MSTLVAARQWLVVSQIHMMPFHKDYAFLANWPGVPIVDQQGVVISQALGQDRSILLAHHGQLNMGAASFSISHIPNSAAALFRYVILIIFQHFGTMA